MKINLIFHKGKKNGKTVIKFEKLGNIGDSVRFPEIYAPSDGCDSCEHASTCNEEYKDGAGNGVGLCMSDVYNGSGRIEFDGEFDTVYTSELHELSQSELLALLDDGKIELIRKYYEIYGMLEDLEACKDESEIERLIKKM